MSISSLLNISHDALASQQIAMDVTGANIANVNTPGYTRQRAHIDALSSVQVSADKTDFHVAVTNIERIYNSYIEMQIVDQSQNLEYSQIQKDILGQIESIFNETSGGGINDLLGKFWNAWENLSTNPNSPIARESLLSVAVNLASLFREYNGTLSDINQNIQSSINDTVSQINDITNEITQLNEKALSLGEAGNANNIMDQRMELIKELSAKINISYYESDDGTVSAFLSNGMPLVEGLIPKQLQVTSTGDIVLQGNPAVVLNKSITGGKLGGLIELRENTVKGYMDSLDQLADGIVDAVNTQHQAGFDVYGIAGGNFFDTTATGAANMKVNPAITADLKKIASSSLNTAVNGENARLIAVLKDNLTMSGGMSTFSDYYASLVGQVGHDVAGVKRSVDHGTQVMDQLQAQREMVSGVSLDEEMMNLMKYQFAYNAAGRLTKVANELLDTLMNLGQ